MSAHSLINYDSNTTRLYAFLPKECLEKGVKPGGWDPQEQVVPAFNPDIVSIDQIAQAFDKPDRVLVEFSPEVANKFYERMTGPDNTYHGIHATKEHISKDYLNPLYQQNSNI